VKVIAAEVVKEAAEVVVPDHVQRADVVQVAPEDVKFPVPV
jgi:hypothetical protein